MLPAVEAGEIDELAGGERSDELAPGF